MLKAYYEKTGTEVKPGDIVTTFHGAEYIFVRATRKRTVGGSGVVAVKDLEGTPREFYDRLFNLTVNDVYVGMEWKQTKSTEWAAKGKDGIFTIVRSAGKFWTSYSSSDTHFKMDPTDKLKDAQAACENSEYWEVVK